MCKFVYIYLPPGFCIIYYFIFVFKYFCITNQDNSFINFVLLYIFTKDLRSVVQSKMRKV